jgi:predicted nucleic acid-binding protein
MSPNRAESSFPMKQVPRKLIEEAGRIKAKCNVSLADSIVLATASQKHGQLVSADRGSFGDVSIAGRIRFHWIR